MIRKTSRLLLLLCALAAPLLLAARDITPDEAAAVADSFYAEKIAPAAATRPHAGNGGRPALRQAGRLAGRHGGGTAVYVFNAGTDDGFVLVAGDDRMPAVVGYATEGRFATDDVPLQLRPLIDAYRALYERLQSQPETPHTASPFATMPQASSPGKAVTPLLGGICWDQEAPFNALCPTDKRTGTATPAGCVAIAAAQIMRHYRYPAQGQGSRSYVTETQRLAVSADFGATAYDWDNMLESYTYGAYSDKQAQAAAVLAYHVGVACKTDYDAEGSGATAKEIAKAFTNYFLYDSNIEYIDHTHYDTHDWEAVMRAELDAGRPVLQFGEGEAGGHAFVCDGYDAEGLFHYNWGWGGMSNGYYNTVALEPSMLGTGSGLGAYNFYQSMLTNLQPPTASSTHTAGLHLAAALQPAAAETARDAETSVRASFYNYGLRNFTGEVSLMLCRADGTPLRALSTKNLNGLRELEGGTPGTNFACAIPSDVEPGTYRLMLMHRESGAADYTAMRAPVTQSNCIVADVTADGVAYAVPAPAPRLSLTAKPALLTPLYNGRRASFAVSVRNDGEEFYSYLGVLLQNRGANAGAVRQYVGVILTRIPAGSTRTLTFTADSIEVDAGAYDVVAVCDPTNALSSYLDAIGPDSLMVTEATVLRRPFLDPAFELAGPMTIAALDGSADIAPGELFTVTAPIVNKGGYGDGDFALIFFNRAEEIIGNSGVVPLAAAPRATTDLRISHRLSVEPGQYGVMLARVEGINAYAVGPATYNGLTFGIVQPTPVTTIEVSASLTDVYTPDGRRVRRGVERSHALDGLPGGIYVVGGRKICK